MNVYAFTGNLTKDCRNAYTPNGKAVCNFTVAVSDGFGENEHTEFVDCALWGKRAEGSLPQYLTKGQKVGIVGLPRINKREHNGNHYANIAVFVESLDLLGSPNSASTGAQKLADSEKAGAQGDDFDDRDIPFAHAWMLPAAGIIASTVYSSLPAGILV